MKFKKRLNESLVDEYIRINIPIKVSFRTDSSDEEDLMKDLKSLLGKEIFDNVEYYSDKAIYEYLNDVKEKIADGLGVNSIDIEHLYLDLDTYSSVPIMNGTLYFDIFLEEQVEEGTIKRVFNTLLNNNIVNREFTITLEDDTYGIFDVIIEVEKLSDIEIGDDI